MIMFPSSFVPCSSNIMYPGPSYLAAVKSYNLTSLYLAAVPSGVLELNRLDAELPLLGARLVVHLVTHSEINKHEILDYLILFMKFAKNLFF